MGGQHNTVTGLFSRGRLQHNPGSAFIARIKVLLARGGIHSRIIFHGTKVGITCLPSHENAVVVLIDNASIQLVEIAWHDISHFDGTRSSQVYTRVDEMRYICAFLICVLKSKISIVVLLAYSIASFYVGQKCIDMGIFASSGGIMSACGLLSLIRFTTIEKYIHQDATIEGRTMSAGPLLSDGEEKERCLKHLSSTHVRILTELRSEMIGIVLIVMGALISSYGAYIPVF